MSRDSLLAAFERISWWGSHYSLRRGNLRECRESTAESVILDRHTEHYSLLVGVDDLMESVVAYVA